MVCLLTPFMYHSQVCSFDKVSHCRCQPGLQQPPPPPPGPWPPPPTFAQPPSLHPHMGLVAICTGAVQCFWHLNCGLSRVRFGLRLLRDASHLQSLPCAGAYVHLHIIALGCMQSCTSKHRRLWLSCTSQRWSMCHIAHPSARVGVIMHIPTLVAVL